MQKNQTIKQAIRRKFPTIGIEDSLAKAMQLMREHNVSVLAVKVQEELIGLVTISDVMFSLAKEDDPEKTAISSFMTKCEFNTTKETRNPCIQLDEDEEIASAIKVMHHAGVNHLLVTGHEGNAIGIVSSLELVKLMAG